MNEIILLVVFLAVGYFAGVLIGMLGIGGGLVFVPALYFLLPLYGISAEQLAYYTVGTSLFAGAVATSNSAILHIRAKNVLLRSAFLVSIGSAITSFLTPYFVVKVEFKIIEIIFASILFLAALKMFLERNNQTSTSLSKPLSEVFYVVLGVLSGILSAFVGIGGGVVYVPALIYLFLIDTKKAVGTSSIIAAVTMIFSAISYLLQNTGNSSKGLGFVMLQAAIPLGVGAIVGSFLGVKLVLTSSTRVIKKIFAVILVGAIIRILFNIW